MVKLFTDDQVLGWLRTNMLTRYWYGTHGHKCTEDLLQRKRKQYPSHYGDSRMSTYRKHIAVVPQNTILFSGTIRDNITYGLPSVSEEKLAQILEAARLTEMIEKLPHGLDTSVGEHGGKLSGGQRQRISIARALIRDPKVIILDEATSALDSVSEKKIQEALDVLTAGRTTFVVAHRLSTIKDADKIAVMESGRCVEFGTYDELMEKKGAFYKYRQLQL